MGSDPELEKSWAAMVARGYLANDDQIFRAGWEACLKNAYSYCANCHCATCRPECHGLTTKQMEPVPAPLPEIVCEVHGKLGSRDGKCPECVTYFKGRTWTAGSLPDYSKLLKALIGLSARCGLVGDPLGSQEYADAVALIREAEGR